MKAALFGLILGFVLCSSARAQEYDLLLKGGHVIDPANQLDEARDVAVQGGKIAAVDKDIPAARARRVVDVSGLYVTPGLLDIHYHTGHGGTDPDWFSPDSRTRIPVLGIPADLALASGVTTIVDAGSSGARTFLRLKEEVMEHATVRVLAFLNIVADGMNSGFEQDVPDMLPELCAETIRKYPALIVGVKTAHYWTEKPWDAEHPPWAAVDRAVACGNLAHVPIMVDFWPRPPERSYPDLLLKHMRPGDIHTHVFAQQFPILDEHGKVNSFLWEARRRGIIFDVGHGAGSFWFRNAVPAVQQGFIPDSISTDRHSGNLNGAVVDQITTMSKLLAMGVPLEDVIRRATVNPAREIHRPELGALSVGSEADIAVIGAQSGNFGYTDCGNAKMMGKQKLVNRMTLRAGRIVYDPTGLSMPEWEKAPKQYFTLPPLQSSPPATATGGEARP
jgi:dihydroorotase